MVFPAVNSEILTIGVFVGIIVSMVWYERELLSPGGVVVPGYTALFLLTNPVIIVYSLLIAFLTALALTFIITPLFGLLSGPFPFLFTGAYSYQGFQVIGIIIPGLKGYGFHRQGVVPTLSTLGVVSVITAIILYVIVILT